MLKHIFADFPPFMSESALACYAELLAKSRNVVEYGAGGSTLLALKSRAAKIISVDADARWVNRLRWHWRVQVAELRGRLSLRYIDIGPVKKWSQPKDDSHRHLWPDYSKAAWQTGGTPDLVFVDGRFRVACIAQTALHAPNATIVVHDFWNRPHYHDALAILEEVTSAGRMGVFIFKSGKQQEAAHLYDKFAFDWR